MSKEKTYPVKEAWAANATEVINGESLLITCNGPSSVMDAIAHINYYVNEIKRLRAELEAARAENKRLKSLAYHPKGLSYKSIAGTLQAWHIPSLERLLDIQEWDARLGEAILTAANERVRELEKTIKELLDSQPTYIEGDPVNICPFCYKPIYTSNDACTNNDCPRVVALAILTESAGGQESNQPT